LKKVFLSSFHTGSVFALLECELDSPSLVSFDSHIDNRMMGYRQEIVENISKNQKMQEAAGRAAAHTIFHFQLNDILHKFLLITSEVCLETDAMASQMQAKKLGGEEVNLFKNTRNKKDVLDEVKKYNKLSFGIDIISCPPKDPITSIKKALGNDDELIFDIDVDYFGDCQNECYTPMKGSSKIDLGNLRRVIKLIQSKKPDLITLSEFKIDALNNPNSNTNVLLNKLKNIGYSIEKFSLVSSDKEAFHYLHLWEDFEKYYHNNTKIAYDLENPTDKKKINELKNMAKVYFEKIL
jgi:hypothetical protein